MNSMCCWCSSTFYWNINKTENLTSVPFQTLCTHNWANCWHRVAAGPQHDAHPLFSGAQELQGAPRPSLFWPMSGNVD